MTNRKAFFVSLLVIALIAVLVACLNCGPPPIRFPRIRVPIPERPTSRPVDFPPPKQMRVAR